MNVIKHNKNLSSGHRSCVQHPGNASLVVSFLSRICIVLFLLSSLTSLHAQTFPELVDQVVDQAGLLSNEQRESLVQALAAHEQQTSNQVVVVTVADLEGYTIADYANRLGRHWGIGTEAEDNGVLMVVAPNERKVRIEVGYGLEGALTDLQSSLIIQREILPALHKNNYASGISNGVTAIMQSIAGEYVATDDNQRNTGTDPFSGNLGKFLPLIFIAMVAIPELLRRTGLRKAANGAFPAGFTGLFGTLATGNLLIGLAIAVAVFLLIYFKSGSKVGNGGRRGGYIGTGGYGGGGIGGGFSGGGGSFGGGGASGSW